MDKLTEATGRARQAFGATFGVITDCITNSCFFRHYNIRPSDSDSTDIIYDYSKAFILFIIHGRHMGIELVPIQG